MEQGSWVLGFGVGRWAEFSEDGRESPIGRPIADANPRLLLYCEWCALHVLNMVIQRASAARHSTLQRRQSLTPTGAAQHPATAAKPNPRQGGRAAWRQGGVRLCRRHFATPRLHTLQQRQSRRPASRASTTGAAGRQGGVTQAARRREAHFAQRDTLSLPPPQDGATPQPAALPPCSTWRHLCARGAIAAGRRCRCAG